MARKHHVQTPGAPAPKNDDSQVGGVDNIHPQNNDGTTGQDTGADSGASAGQGDSNTGDSAGIAPDSDLAEQLAQAHRRIDELNHKVDAVVDSLSFLSRRLDIGQAQGGSVLGNPPKHAQHSRDHYAKMRAHEVDPTKITAPVLTLDGHVVPAPKEVK